MKTEKSTKQARLEFFRSLFENAKRHAAQSHDDFQRCMEQYKGSKEIDGSGEEALTVRNITYEIIESQVSSDIPMPKADATSYSEKRGRNAESIERLCRSIRDRLPFEELNDIDERYTYVYGGSVWYVEWENNKNLMSEIGSVKIHCLSPKDFIPQPAISSIDDMEYCFLVFTTTRAELSRQYDVSEEELEDAESAYEYGGSPQEDAVYVTVCFYKDEDAEIGRYVFSADVVLSDIERFYHRKAPICKKCTRTPEKCDCQRPVFVEGEIARENVTEKIMARLRGIPLTDFTSYDSLSLPTEEDVRGLCRDVEVEYFVPHRFPIVIRKNTSGENSLFGQSDCDYIRPEQQAINKIESRILQKLLRAGVTPVVPEDASISINNQVFGQVIKMKPGESLAQYGKVDTTPDISQDIAEAERLYDHAKRVIGISDAYQGIDTSVNESGVAKQLRISQATGRLQSKRKMKDTAYASIDRIIFELYLAFADEPRKLSYKDAYGRIHEAEFNRYDFIEYDEQRCRYYFDDSYLFSVDLNDGADYSRETLWQRNLENLKAGTLGDPSSPVTLLRYWQCQERAHYPHARENVEYFTLAIEEAKGGDSYGYQ